MKAVIWTDVLQAIVILVGLLAAIIQGWKNDQRNIFSFINI
jgi:Na+/proline symporter